jgi:putative aldouronate transport system substrate-binding protein
MGDDESLTVVFGPEDPAYVSLLETVYRWSQEGYTAPELPTRADARDETRAGLHVVGNHVMWPGNDIVYSQNLGRPFVIKALTDPLLTTGAATSTLTGIWATSEHPEKAMEVMELLYSNTGGVFTMLTRGIEGKHWEWVDQDQNLIKFLAEDPTNSGYYPNTDWSLGNTFLAPLTDPGRVGISEKIIEMNETAMPSVALGFTFNPEPVETELAAVSAVEHEYGVPLREGQLDPATALPTYIEKLKEAGIDVVIAELQQQLNDWAAK